MQIPTVPITNWNNPILNEYDDKYFNANKSYITNMFDKHDLQKRSMKTNIHTTKAVNETRDH